MNTDYIQEGKNTGLTDAKPEVNSWVAGGETGAVPVILEPSGQYDQYLPDEESQAVFVPSVFDSFGCVSFSALNSIEILINRIRAKGILPVTHETFLQENGYVNKQTGKVNFSDKFTAKMSGTTQAGNSLGAVAESIRSLHGLLPEIDLPSEPKPGETWQSYYTPISLAHQAKAKKFLTYFKINYQWVLLGTSTPAEILSWLPQGPIQIAAKVCSPWASNEGMPPIAACGCSTQHATTIYGSLPTAWKDFDHYKSFKKLLSKDYCIPYAVQYYLTVITPSAPGTFHYVFNKNLYYYEKPSGTEVNKLQEALQFLRDKTGTPYMAKGVFGPYGPATRTALAKFQKDNGIQDNGTNFGPQTRAKMNALIA